MGFQRSLRTLGQAHGKFRAGLSGLLRTLGQAFEDSVVVYGRLTGTSGPYFRDYRAGVRDKRWLGKALRTLGQAFEDSAGHSGWMVGLRVATTSAHFRAGSPHFRVGFSGALGPVFRTCGELSAHVAAAAVPSLQGRLSESLGPAR